MITLPNKTTNAIARLVTISAIIWLVIAIYQILVGLVFLIFGVGIATLACGGWNIYACIKNLKHADYVRKCDNPYAGAAIVNAYENSLGSNIIFLVVNLILGGGLGVIGAIFDLFLRSYVLKHRAELGGIKSIYTIDQIKVTK